VLQSKYVLCYPLLSQEWLGFVLCVHLFVFLLSFLFVREIRIIRCFSVKVLFTLLIVYTKLRLSFFNRERFESILGIDLPVSEIPTLEQCFILLDNSLLNETGLICSNGTLCAFQSTLSRKTNKLPLPFMINTRHMSGKAAAEGFVKAGIKVMGVLFSGRTF
jgi:hypothetical protein